MAKYTITIKDLPEGMEVTDDEMKKVVGGVLAMPTLQKNVAKLGARLKNPAAGGDCDCWSHTACAPGGKGQILR